MDTASKKFVIIAASMLAALFGATAAVNTIVNPNLVFGDIRDGFLPYKETLPEVLAKAEMARKLDYDTLYLGTSRAEVGLDPLSPYHGGKLCFNGGLAACKIDEALGIFQLAIARNELKRVYLVVDEMLVRAGEANSYDYLISRANPELRVSEYYLLGLFGYRSINDSLKTIRNRIDGNVVAEGEGAVRGHYPMDREIEGTTQRGRFNKIEIQYLSPGRGFYAAHVYTTETLDFVGTIAQMCADRGIELVMIIPPIHAILFEGMRELDMWKDFEQMKRDLVRITETSPGKVSLWDFAGYSPYNTEPAPVDDSSGPLQWFYEPSHFRPALGERILQQVNGAIDEAGFGVRLTSANIDDRIARIRADREAWAAENQAEIEWIRSIVHGRTE